MNQSKSFLLLCHSERYFGTVRKSLKPTVTVIFEIWNDGNMRGMDMKMVYLRNYRLLEACVPCSGKNDEVPAWGSSCIK
jgi:hypothetical protein